MLLSTIAALQRRCMSTLATAYVYHPKVQTCEADLQVYQWAKTQEVNTRPPIVEQLRNQLSLEPFKTLIEKNIIVARTYETQEEYTPKTYPFGLMQNILKTILNHAHVYPHLKGLHVSHNPDVAATWNHAQALMAVRGRPGTVFTSKTKLPQFFDGSFAEESKAHTFASTEPLSPYIDLKQYGIYLDNATGFRPKRLFPFFHTLVVVDNEAVQEIQLLQKGIMYTFGQLVAQAIEKHGSQVVGKELPEPECGQCLVTNGKRFSFIWYQLNTLDMTDVDKGVKNLVHVERPGFLYTKLKKVFPKGVHVVEDLNDEVLRTLLTTILVH